MVMLAILASMLLPAMSRACTKCQRISCVNNLRQIGTAFYIWENDNGNKYPWEVSTNLDGSKEYVFGPVFRHFQVMQNELGQSAKVVTCPEDQERKASTNFDNFNNQNVSYFLGVTASTSNASGKRSNLFLSGDRNLTNVLGSGPGMFFLTTNASVGWSRQIHTYKKITCGNILFADGRVVVLPTKDLRKKLNETGAAPAWISLP
jgi:prepilin-type processing-associated H-X9-DG protein